MSTDASGAMFGMMHSSNILTTASTSVSQIFSSTKRRKLNSKAKFESGVPYFSFKALKSGAFNTGFKPSQLAPPNLDELGFGDANQDLHKLEAHQRKVIVELIIFLLLLGRRLLRKVGRLKSGPLNPQITS